MGGRLNLVDVRELTIFAMEVVSPVICHFIPVSLVPQVALVGFP